MTIPKKIYARFYDFHGRPAIEEAYPGGDGKDEETDHEYTLSTEVDKLVKALELALDLIAVYGAENSKDGGKIKKMLAQYRKE